MEYSLQSFDGGERKSILAVGGVGSISVLRAVEIMSLRFVSFLWSMMRLMVGIVTEFARLCPDLDLLLLILLCLWAQQLEDVSLLRFVHGSQVMNP